jgi:lipopolysaccharide transport system permease protein
MKAALRNISVATGDGAIVIRVTLENRSPKTWPPDRIFLGWQLFDPETNRFISDGEWIPLPAPVEAKASVELEVRIAFPPEHGSYHIYVSPVESEAGWLYARGEKFLLISAEVTGARVRVAHWELTSTRQIRLRNLRRIAPELLLNPLLAIGRNRRLIWSMVRRDILARYRGSFGGALWAVLNPLLLMSTYFFVFGVVLRQRFGTDSSGSGYVLYLLAGMIPWLAVNEAISRSPYTILEYRTFVRKLVFPLETLNAIQVASSLVTETVALAIFLVGLLLVRGAAPASIVWLPALIVPQVLFTLGICWFLAALGAFARDLGQVIGFVMTIWFFLTPICYAEEGIPKQAAGLLTKNPMYFLVHAYRDVLLKGQAPEWRSLMLFTAMACCVFLLGHAWFYKLRRNFADVI